MNKRPELTVRDHANMDSFLGQVLDGYKQGRFERGACVNGLAHVMTALASGNEAEARSWFEQGIAFISQN